MKKTVLLVSVLLIMVVLTYIITGLLLRSNEPIESPNILLEGWMSHIVMEEASNKILDSEVDSIFIIGMKNADSFATVKDVKRTEHYDVNRKSFVLSSNGVLGFEISTEKLNDSCSISFLMRGKSDLKYKSHFEIFVNGEIIDHGFASEKDSLFTYNITNVRKDSLFQLFINFDNDRYTEAGDRNLYISEVKVDTFAMKDLALDIYKIGQKEYPNLKFASRLNTIKYYLADFGCDTATVKIIEIDRVTLNKSIAFAKGAQQYFHLSKNNSFNLITVDIHSKRSYLNFKNCLNKDVVLGCIPVKRNEYKRNTFYQELDERISLIYTWLYWLFN